VASACCIRCFAVFAFDDVRPGALPVCPDCAAVVGGSAAIAPPAPPAPARGARTLRRLLLAALAVVAAAGVVAGAAVGARAAFRWFRARPTPRPAAVQPHAGEEAVAAWRAAGLLPGGPGLCPAADRGRGPGEPGSAGVALDAAGRVRTGEAALRADVPARTREALQCFREALAAAPDRDDATAGYATALAEGGLDTVSGDEIGRAHALLDDALTRHPDAPGLLAARVRLLLGVRSEANTREARALATRALSAAPGDAGVELAAGLAEEGRDPAAAAAALTRAAAAAPEDRRLLTAAARARWEADDAPGALELVRARLAVDPGHAGASRLAGEIALATDRQEDARAAYHRWAEAQPADAEPLLLLARLAHQRDGDLGEARRLLAAAMQRAPDDFLAARILAHRAAAERDAGELAAAQSAAAEGLRRVPASAPARFQAALLARAGDEAALRTAAGVVGDRGGPEVAALLAALVAEQGDDTVAAVQAWGAYQAAAGPDPAAALAAGGALLRLRAGGPALEAARRALALDLADARLRRPPTDFWEGPARLAEAARAYEALAGAEPRAAGTALAAAAAAELLLGHTQVADRLIRSAHAALPQAAAPDCLGAQLELDLGRPARALAAARAAVKAEPASAPALAALARALRATGQPAAAERAARGALSLDPDLRAVRLVLAQAVAARDAEEARRVLASLRRDAPDLAEARRALLDLPQSPTR
jgi:tetratricopeptide (TPR) repeat protein